MRILHIGKYFPPARGGMESFLADLVRAQRAAGDEPAVLVHAHARSHSRDDPPWLVRCAVWFNLVFAPVSPLFAFCLHRAIRRFKPEVLHIHVPNASAFWALLLPSARRIPWVVHWHADVVASQFSLGLRLAYPHYAIFERALLERAEAIIVTSPQYLDSSEPLVPWRHKCHVVPLAVDRARLPEPQALKPASAWSGEGVRLLAVGRLTYYKGFDTLVRAVAGETGMQLVIVGAGDERPALERLAGEAAPAPVQLVGELDDEALCALIASCDVFCLPSIERTEAFGVVLLEAMRYGKPVVASAIEGSGVNYVARQGQNAMLVAPGDPAAWRDALRALARSPTQRQMLGHLGRERFDREFAIDPVAARVRRLYALARHLAAAAAPAGRSYDHAVIEPLEEPTSGERSDRQLVVIPALNEAECIGHVIAQARATPGVDVLVVDDGSTDDTVAVALLSGAMVLSAPLWQGAWGAIQTGIRYGLRHGYAGVITMDADGQHLPGDLPRLVEAARAADVVIAACPSRGSLLRHVAWRYFRLLTGFSLDDLTSGFRYYNAKACRLLATEEATLLDYQDIGVLMLLHRAKMRIAEIPVAMHPRRDGGSRVFSSWWTVARYMAETSLLCLARWNWRTYRLERR